MSRVLGVEGLNKSFSSSAMFSAGSGVKRAVIDHSFDLMAGETLAIVGESGSGKSTTARLAMKLLDSDSGRIFWGQDEVTNLSGHALRSRRRHIQMVFQDPFASLNPRMRIWESVAEGLRVYHPELSRSGRRDRVAETMNRCGLDTSAMDRYPHQFSGGQRQRIGIARALIVEPSVLVLDEPVSALDVSVQAQILNLLRTIQQQSGIAYLFISHDLSVVRHIADRVSVMFAGHVVEQGAVDRVFEHCRHPYTEALLAARPISHPDERQHAEALIAADEGVAATGCPFARRCSRVEDDCHHFDSSLNSDGFACLHAIERS